MATLVVKITAATIGWDDLIVKITWYCKSSGDEPMLHLILFEGCDRSKQDGSMLTCEQLRTTSVSRVMVVRQVVDTS